MKQKFQFSNEIESALPGCQIEETFSGVVELFEDDDTDPYILELYRDGVECAVPPRAVSIADWNAFESRCIQAARDTQWIEHLKEIAE